MPWYFYEMDVFLLTREHPESANFRQGKNVTGIVFHGGENILDTVVGGR